jgi:sugar O-acyltransferase (sialic acid O-acetyltransferase NeuD family)
MAKIAIYGAGGFGQEVGQFLASDHEAYFVTDDNADIIAPDDKIVLAIGDSRSREALHKRYEGQILDRAVASTAVIRSDCGAGAVFCDFTMVTAPVQIGRQFQCNIYSYVAHDCVIGDYVTFAPQVCCNGNVTIGDHAYIGTGATIRQGVTIGAHAIVGMGAVVVKDVPAGATVMGNPAR